MLFQSTITRLYFFKYEHQAKLWNEPNYKIEISKTTATFNANLCFPLYSQHHIKINRNKNEILGKLLDGVRALTDMKTFLPYEEKE